VMWYQKNAKYST